MFMMTTAQVQEAPARGSSPDLPASLQMCRFRHQLGTLPGVFHRHLNSASVNLHNGFFCLLFSSYYLRSWLSQLVVNGSRRGQPWFPSFPLPFNQWGGRALLRRRRVYCVCTMYVRQALCTPGAHCSLRGRVTLCLSEWGPKSESATAGSLLFPGFAARLWALKHQFIHS